ncbi:MAG: undecaprenyl-diphosphate phosphatase [Sphingobacteriales bacterium]
MNTIQAIIIAIIEGLTEFIPISSTGHMAITSAFMGIGDEAFTKLYEVVIQFGAIVSVVVLYWKKFIRLNQFSFYIKLIIAIIPALIFGGLFKSHIESVLGKPWVIATVMLVGGFILLFVDKWFMNPEIKQEEDISNKQAFIIGCYQVLSVIFPGLSRSAATIIGGMQQKLSRPLAAEFSFFLAVPTMMAATVKSLYDVYNDTPEVLNGDYLNILLLGCITAFVVALLAIQFFIGFLQKNGFRVFGIYRIIVGGILLILIANGKL